jgi:glycosyltransferase involved in cell wall biosynthesis
MSPIVIVGGASLKTKNGISRVVSELSEYLNENAIIVTDKYDPLFGFEISKKVHIIEIGRILDHLVLAIKLAIKLVALATIYKRVALVSNSFKATFLSTFFRALFPRKVRLFFFIYDKEDLDLLKRSPFRYFMFRFILRLGLVDRVLVLDNRMARLLAKEFTLQRIYVIRIGVSSSLLRLYDKMSKGAFSPPKTLYNIFHVSPGTIKLFFHGILIPRRRIEDLLIALSLLIKRGIKNFVLYISGSMNWNRLYSNYLLNLKKKLGLDNYVFFLNSLTEDELAYAYHMMDIFVFPCDNQTWGLAPLEATLFGKPVVVSTGSGVSEVLNENVALLVPPRDPISLRDSIMKLLSDEKLRKTIGTNARQYVLTKLTFERTAKELMNLFNTAFQDNIS